MSYIEHANYILQGNFPTLDYTTLEVHNNHEDQQIDPASSSDHNKIVDYMLNTPPLQQQQQQASANFYGSNSFDKLSFADVMQFADFGPKLGLNQSKSAEEESSYFLKFPVLNEHKLQDDEHQEIEDKGEKSSVQLRFADEKYEKSPVGEGKSVKRKRARSVKSIEEVESQRMTHIAVERNRRKQMNEHLRVLRSLMPSSYVQRVISNTCLPTSSNTVQYKQLILLSETTNTVSMF